MNATWPLASLEVSSDLLRLSGLLLGDNQLAPTDVVEIKKTGLPVVSGGVKIVHRRPDLPEKLIFYHVRPSHVMREIETAGFAPAGKGLAPMAPRTDSGTPFKLPYLVVGVVLWNILFLLEFSWMFLGSDDTPSRPGPYALMALLGTFVISTLVLHSETVRQLLLKPGRGLGYVRNQVRLVQVVTAFIAVVVLFFLFAPVST